jgi:hypothetical protein
MRTSLSSQQGALKEALNAFLSTVHFIATSRSNQDSLICADGLHVEPTCESANERTQSND